MCFVKSLTHLKVLSFIPIKFKPCLLIALITLVLVSCNRSDEEISPIEIGLDQTTAFMAYEGSNTYVLGMMEAFRQEDSKQGVSKAIIEKHGYAKWDLALIDQKESGITGGAFPVSGDTPPSGASVAPPQVVVPIIDPVSGEIMAILAYRDFSNGKRVFRLYSKKKLAKIPYKKLLKNKYDRNAALVFLIFENKINSKTSIRLNDKTVSFKTTNTVYEWNYELQCQDWEICWDATEGNAAVADCSYGTNCEYVLVESDGGGGDGGDDPLPPDGGGSGGSGPGDPNDPEEPDEIISKIIILLEQDSTKLINILCSELEKWKEVGGFKPSSLVMDKINIMKQNKPWYFPSSFDIQTLEDAAGTIVNMDYFPVKVNSLPNNMTPEQFLSHIRLNINSFINTDLSSFSTEKQVNTGFDETANWQSDNPVGSVIHIDIPIDQGSVIVTYNDNSKWRFSTIKTPSDALHPVSGTREFGFKQALDGSYTFYTRGVDRITTRLNELIGERKTFDGADGLWKSFQEKIFQYVQNNGGAALKLEPVIGRPDWKEVSDVIHGIKPVSSLGCKN